MDRPAPASPAAGHAPLEIRVEPAARDAMPRRSAPSSTTRCSSSPAFLAHYRRLGADRFVILDDRSTDGTVAFLAAQPDVMVVGERHPLLRGGLLPAGGARADPRDPGGPPLARPDARPVLRRPVGGRWSIPTSSSPCRRDLPTFFARARRRGRRGGLGGDGRHVPRAGARHPRARTPRASASRTPGTSTRNPTSTRGSAAPTPPRPARRRGAAHRLSGQRGAALRHLGGPAARAARPAAPPPALGLPLPGRQHDQQDAGGASGARATGS